MDHIFAERVDCLQDKSVIFGMSTTHRLIVGRIQSHSHNPIVLSAEYQPNPTVQKPRMKKRCMLEMASAILSNWILYRAYWLGWRYFRWHKSIIFICDSLKISQHMQLGDKLAGFQPIAGRANLPFLHPPQKHVCRQLICSNLYLVILSCCYCYQLNYQPGRRDQHRYLSAIFKSPSSFPLLSSEVVSDSTSEGPTDTASRCIQINTIVTQDSSGETRNR